MTETDLAKLLGVDRDIVKKQRPYALTGGVRLTGKTIEWSDSACLAVAIALALPTEVFKKNAPQVASGAGTVPDDGIESLTVVSAPSANGKHFPNPHIIKAKRAGGEVVCVRVMDSAKYQPTLWNAPGPMVIKAKKSVGGNWWELISREPRWRGRF